MKKFFWNVLDSILTVLIWILFAAVIRPAVLVAELLASVFWFVFDIVTFPFKYLKSDQESEGDLKNGN